MTNYHQKLQLQEDRRRRKIFPFFAITKSTFTNCKQTTTTKNQTQRSSLTKHSKCLSYLEKRGYHPTKSTTYNYQPNNLKLSITQKRITHIRKGYNQATFIYRKKKIRYSTGLNLKRIRF